MNEYLDMPKTYLAAHKRRTRLSILSIVLSVALVAGLFSLLDVLMRFEKIQTIHDYGNYHILIKDATAAEKEIVSGRIDVKNTGTWLSLENGTVNGGSCGVIAIDEPFASNMGIHLLEGTFPEKENELMLEAWAADKLNAEVGDSVSFAFHGKEPGSFRLSGIFSDYGSTKASDEPGVVLSMKAASASDGKKAAYFLIEFKNRTNIRKAEKQIKDTLSLSDGRVGRNEHLLAVLGQSDYKAAVGLYEAGAVLFLIVLIAGIVMIYNTFNISVMERMRAFGLLRCIGASKAQIRRIVKKEGFLLLRFAIPFGLLLGMVVTLFCCALLKFLNSHLFSGIPLFIVSPSGLLAGTVVGVLTVSVAAQLPAKKASGVSPLNAVTGNTEIKAQKMTRQRPLARLLPVEAAMGIGSAVSKKKTLILMSSSVALSIILFLGFQVFVGFLYANLKTTKPYTPDVSITSESGLDDALYADLSSLDGVKRVYGRMFSHIDASFDYTRLTDAYKQEVGAIVKTPDGRFVPPEKSWLISYDENQLKWSQPDLVEGTLSEEALNASNGIIAVLMNIRKGVSSQTADVKIGDKVTVQALSGEKEYTVMAVLRTVPFSDDQLNLTTFITTEKLYTEITSDTSLDVINIQLKPKNQEQTISEIKRMAGDGARFYDSRQQNSEMNQTFLTLAIFVYGFVAVIAFISILNIMNTMQTSVSSKTRYLGVMRAVGMSARQLRRMILFEAGAYGILGSVSGVILGVLLQRGITKSLLSGAHMTWEFPFMQVVGVFLLAFLITVLSVISPLRKIKSRGISETIGSLQ